MCTLYCMAMKMCTILQDNVHGHGQVRALKLCQQYILKKRQHDIDINVVLSFFSVERCLEHVHALYVYVLLEMGAPDQEWGHCLCVPALSPMYVDIKYLQIDR